MTPEEIRTARAGEYVLGLLDDEALARFEEELAADQELAREVASLAGRFEALQEHLPHETASEELWRKIAERLDREGEAASASAPTSPPRVAPPRRRGLSGWQNALLAACLLAAFGLGYVGGQFMQPAPEPVVVVVLVDDDEVPAAFMEAYGDDRVRIVPLRDFDVPGGKVMEAWTMFDEDVGPVSLGTFSQPRELVLAGPDLPRPQADQFYAITLEDAPGSPVGRPLGPMLVQGLAVRPPR
ncbi:anti-sigma factor [Chelativorans sp. ZYF759]|uniref:anti-sigma factor n=1 Tax=Chelativorans sp. ZYF759 TaxID=2692213 RepID=UPI00145E133A|nr:anti-sigma factor [Chelativorans sp. ZYF759]NMG40392.1 anti-sigma factor [Chelativorans sp. ZYF759]